MTGDALGRILLGSCLALLCACETEPAQHHWLESLGSMETIAGLGEQGEDGVSHWLPPFEGMPATMVELSRPHIAMADAQGRVYIADKDAHAIRRIELDHRLTTVAGTSLPGDDGDVEGPATQRRLHSPNGLWVAADGRFFVLDLGNDCVRRVSTQGAMSTLFRVPGGISQGRGLWVSEDERLVWLASGDRVLLWTAEAGIRTFATGFVELGHLMPERDGRLLVADRGGHRVYRLSFDGASREVLAGTGQADGRRSLLATQTSLAGVRALWLLDDQSLLLGTHEGSQLWHVEPSGRIELLIDGEPGAHAGDGEAWRSPGKKLSELRSVTVAPNGDLLITENDRGFVRRVRAAQER